jgi:hypothetical protein
MREMQSSNRSAAGLVRQTRRGFAARVAICIALSALALGAFPGLATAVINLPPLVNLKPAVQTATGFELRGSVDPYGLDTHYRFEYGTTTSYGTSVPVPDADAGSSEGFVPVAQQVTGLQPATTYHFRLVATNSAGPRTSEDGTFTTPSAGSGVPPSNQFSVGSATTKGATATLAISVPDPGTLSASGRDLKSASATATGAGTVKLKLKLNGAGSKALKKAKNHKLKLKVKINFQPAGGSPGTAIKTLMFKQAGKGN